MSSGGGRRRLSAALRADMVGSTELMAARGVDESIEARHRYADVINQHCAHGTRLDTRGDGVMVGFTSASAAVRAALSVQRAMAHIDDFDLRVAVTIDEVAATGGESFLDVERRSAAIEASCPPGKVVVDGRTCRATRGDAGLRYEPLTGSEDTCRAVGDSAHEAPQSELQAVLFTDLAESAEPATAQRARSIGEEVIAAHDGAVVDTNGGGHVAVFTSCTDALAAAEMLHERAVVMRLGSSDDEHFHFRAGVSIGDVVVADGAGFGVAMVEAARLLDSADSDTTVLMADVIAIARLSRQRPVLLVVDDVQWGEVDTLRMIEHLISRSDPHRLMIVATCRSEHLDRDHPVQILLRASRPGHRVEHVPVDRLSTSDVVSMLEARNERKLLDHQVTSPTS